MSVLNYHALQREVKTRAHNIGLSIQFDDNACPSTNGKVITLHKPAPNMNPHEETVWWYMFEHELGHNHPDLQGTWDLMKEKHLNIDSILGMFFNCLEDHRQELYDKGMYRGRDQRIQKGFHSFVTKNIDPATFGQNPDIKRWAAETLMTADIEWRVEWMPKLAGVSSTYTDHFTPEMMEAYNKLTTGDYGTILKSGIDERECYDLALRILDEVFDIPPEQAEQEARDAFEQAQQGEGDGEGQGNSGSSGNESSDCEEDAQDSGGQDASGEKSDGEPAKGTQGARVDYRDLLAHTHDQEGGEYATEESHSSLTIDYSNWESGHRWPDTDRSSWSLNDYIKSPAGNLHKYGQKGLDAAAGSQISKQVKRHLMIKSQARYEHAQKRGKISPKSLYRAAGTGEAARKVFKKKHTSDMLDTSVLVLVDFSGSMGGPKMVNASASMLLLNEAIGQLSVPLEIIGFTDNYSDAPKHGILKSFNKRISTEQLAMNIGSFARSGMNANSDGESLLFAYERLIRQQSKRKILLLLSDGQPASCAGDSYGHTKHVAKEIEKAGLVELCSIGILDDTVRSIYSNFKVINSSDELEAAVLDVIKTRIIKHS